jgi:hypothetical protein
MPPVLLFLRQVLTTFARAGLKLVILLPLPPECWDYNGVLSQPHLAHKMEYYSATKKNAVLIYSTTWMKFKNILSESHT